MAKRQITRRQEEAIRLVHHDFAGLTQKEAAKIMGITQPTLNRLLAVARKNAPQLFPILTKFEAGCYRLFMDEGLSVKQISSQLNKDVFTIYKALGRAKKKGMPFPIYQAKILSYNPSMDDEIKQKF